MDLSVRTEPKKADRQKNKTDRQNTENLGVIHLKELKFPSDLFLNFFPSRNTKKYK
jgi:hypothetical protein